MKDELIKKMNVLCNVITEINKHFKKHSSLKREKYIKFGEKHGMC